jgi:hypothetical protein
MKKTDDIMKETKLVQKATSRAKRKPNPEKEFSLSALTYRVSYLKKSAFIPARRAAGNFDPGGVLRQLSVVRFVGRRRVLWKN